MLLLLATGAARAEPGPWLRIETGAHEALINGLALLDGGRAVVTVSDDKTARVWSAGRLDPQEVLRPPIGPQDQGALYAVAANAAGRIAVAGRIGTPGNYAIALFQHPPAGGAAPASLPGGWAAPPGADPAAAPAVATTRPLGTISGLPHEVSALRFAPNGNLLAVGMQANGGLRLFDIKASAELPGDPSYGGAVRGIDFDPQGHIATTSDDGKVRFYGADGQRFPPLGLGPGARPWGIAFSPDGRMLAVGDRLRPLVWLIDPASQRVIRALEGAPGRVGGLFALAFGPDGSYLVAAGSYNDPATQRYYARSFNVSGRGAGETPIADDIVTAIGLLPDGMVFTTAEPAVGRTDGTGATSIRRAAHHIDFRDAGLASFRLSADGGRIELPAERGSGRHIVFDLPSRTLELREGGPDMTAPQLESRGLSITDWRGSSAPRVNGRPIRLEPAETARSAAIAPGGEAVAIGTDFFVRYLSPTNQIWRQVADAPVWAVNVSADGRRVVAGLGDGSVHWYSAATGEQLASLFIEPATARWVLWTPEGFFDHNHPTDGTTDGRGLIGYALNRADGKAADFIQIGQLYPSFFRPDMIGLSFRDTDEAREAVLAQRQRVGPVRALLAQGLPPSLRVLDVCGNAGGNATGCPDQPKPRPLDHRGADGVLETDGTQVLIDYKLQSSSAGVGRAILARNQAVITPAAFTIEEDDRSRTLEAAIPLGVGLNVIRLTPVAASGEVEGARERSIELRIVRRPPAVAAVTAQGETREAGTPPAGTPPAGTPAKPAAPAKPPVTLYVLSVGVSHFQHKELDLDNAVNDARAVADLFKGSDPPVYDQAVIATLLDGQVTSANIAAGIAAIAKQAGPDDVVVLFFAGHGQQVDGKYFYAPVDFGMHDQDLFHRAMAGHAGKDDPLDELFRREGFGQAQMLAAIQAIQASRVALILDTCFSASIATQDAVMRRDTNATVTNGLGHASGRFVLSSATALALDSAGAAASLPTDQQGHGLFTSFLLRALRGEADNDRTGRIDVYKLTMFTLRAVAKATASLREAQEPSYFLNGQFFNLRAVAVN
jgi:hypothetical protein